MAIDPNSRTQTNPIDINRLQADAKKSATASQNLETAASVNGQLPVLSAEQAKVYPISAVIAQSIKTNNRSPFEAVSNTTSTSDSLFAGASTTVLNGCLAMAIDTLSSLGDMYARWAEKDRADQKEYQQHLDLQAQNDKAETKSFGLAGLASNIDPMVAQAALSKLKGSQTLLKNTSGILAEATLASQNWDSCYNAMPQNLKEFSSPAQTKDKYLKEVKQRLETEVKTALVAQGTTLGKQDADALAAKVVSELMVGLSGKDKKQNSAGNADQASARPNDSPVFGKIFAHNISQVSAEHLLLQS